MTDEPLNATLARMTLDALRAVMDEAPPDIRNEIVRYRAEMDRFRVDLREGGWTEGQIGALIFDGLQRKGLPHEVVVVIAMETMK